MASDLLSLPNCLSTTQIPPTLHNRHRLSTLSNDKFLNRSLQQLNCAATKQDIQLTQNGNRCSAKYAPNIWTHEIVQSLENNLAVETVVPEKARKLEENVRLVINRIDMEPLSLLELIDDIQRLGLHHRFEEDINRALERIVSTENFKDQSQNSLHETALLFRLLRQHGFYVSEDVFESFKDEEGKLKVEISNDVQGLLSLYEASYLSLEGETIWEAKAFSRTHLMNLRKEGIESTEVAEQVRHVLEGLPFHQSFQRLDARRYFDIYNKKEQHNPSLLELAKLDFNMVQSLYQKELKQLSRWWKDIDLGSKLNHFARDRYVESFFWSVGMIPEPEFTNCRQELAKAGQLITSVDDVYDTYGTLAELELFTEAFERWDVDVIDTLPDDMILCFLAVYNTVNELAYNIFKDRGIKCLPYLRKSWSDLCKAYLHEAKWFHQNKVIPPFKEFLENGWISSGGGVLLVHSYFLVCQDQDVTEQALHSLANYHEFLRPAMTILRLCNDLGTSTDEVKMGEISTSIVSYMHETGLSEEKVHQYFKTLIDKEWQYLTKCQLMGSTFSKSIIQVAINFSRISRHTYQCGDGYGRQDDKTKGRVKLLLIDPVEVNGAC